MRTYSELITFPTFKERFEYLKLDGAVADVTFGFDRYLNQILYRSPEWRSVRNEVIVRDNGLDLSKEGFEIAGRVIVHHMNPITIDDIVLHDPKVFNPEFLISVSHNTHNAIHYGDYSLISQNDLIERTPNDTCPWR